MIARRCGRSRSPSRRAGQVPQLRARSDGAIWSSACWRAAASSVSSPCQSALTWASSSRSRSSGGRSVMTTPPTARTTAPAARGTAARSRAAQRAIRRWQFARRRASRPGRREARSTGRWATTSAVVVDSTFRSADCTCASVCTSNADSGSSSTSTRGRPSTARAKASRCRCPPDSDMPCSPIRVSSPNGKFVDEARLRDFESLREARPRSRPAGRA